jgi:hypothetical protein
MNEMKEDCLKIKAKATSECSSFSSPPAKDHSSLGVLEEKQLTITGD